MPGVTHTPGVSCGVLDQGSVSSDNCDVTARLSLAEIAPIWIMWVC